MNAFIRSFASEWLKRKRSLAAWLVVCGAFFTPAIIFTAKLIRHGHLAAESAQPTYWQHLWKSAWESMAIFLLPLGVILATSLITQLEYKNNSWKLLHTTPQRYSVIFGAKLAVVLVMMGQFLLLFNVGIYLAGVLPGLLLGVPYPAAPIPYAAFLSDDGRYLVACLPIVALQYLISLRFRNFLVPVGGGLALWILSVAVLSWQYGYLIPYTYCSFTFLQGQPRFAQPVALLPWAVGYFLLFTGAAYGLYVQQREKG
ncbi:ABC transporter permease [Hymenobacter negativus]|uniref:ABC transporter permease n=1 Tax=Hymenobacter negativus TaxID=2795026 RepID=A0ABS3QN30_9BACT|nr:ABC transporter permease [Hymenobacter negativus]MBO2012100.1 ABC transporter permease [Hymenobacter negativus]